MATETVPRLKSPNGQAELTWHALPTHLDLPESDGTFVKNFQEHPQSVLLTDSIRPILEKKHPDRRFAIGQDSGIYWRLTDPLERGIWHGRYWDGLLPWLRWWDADGKLLLTGDERAERLAAQLRALGIEPDA